MILLQLQEDARVAALHEEEGRPARLDGVERAEVASAAEATSARLTLRMTSPDCRPPASAARSSA